MRCYDTLTKGTVSIKPEELVITNQKSLDYVISIPHGGSLVPLGFKKQISTRKVTFDPFTKDLFNFKKGIYIISNVDAHLVNFNRANTIPKNAPKHLRTNPFSNDIRYTKQEKKELLRYYHKYHSLLNKSIQKVHKKNGFALFFDAHSLSSIGPKKAPDYNKKRPDFVIGTLDGKSADKQVINIFINTLKKECKDKYSVKKDYPYKGGFTLVHHSHPNNHIFGIQIEVNRSIYMRKNSLQPDPEKIKNITAILFNAIDYTSSKTKTILK